MDSLLHTLLATGCIAAAFFTVQCKENESQPIYMNHSGSGLKLDFEGKQQYNRQACALHT